MNHFSRDNVKNTPSYESLSIKTLQRGSHQKRIYWKASLRGHVVAFNCFFGPNNRRKSADSGWPPAPLEPYNYNYSINFYLPLQLFVKYFLVPSRWIHSLFSCLRKRLFCTNIRFSWNVIAVLTILKKQ